MLLILGPLLDPPLEQLLFRGRQLLVRSGGGIISSSSLLVTRRHISLLARLPGTTACTPSCSTVAPSGVSNRSSACRFFASNPWQAKHLLDRIGRISRLNESVPSAAVPAIGSASQPIRH